MNDEELTRLAEAELLREAKNAAERVEIMGPEGWRKCPSRNINKRFLVSTIRDAVYTNKKIKINNKNVYYREDDSEKCLNGQSDDEKNEDKIIIKEQCDKKPKGNKCLNRKDGDSKIIENKSLKKDI